MNQSTDIDAIHASLAAGAVKVRDSRLLLAELLNGYSLP